MVVLVVIIRWLIACAAAAVAAMGFVEPCTSFVLPSSQPRRRTRTTVDAPRPSSSHLPEPRTVVSASGVATTNMKQLEDDFGNEKENLREMQKQQLMLSDLNDRLQVLEETLAPEALGSFFEPAQYSFSLKPGGTAQRLSITSTCFALQAILAASRDPNVLYQSFLTLDTRIRQLEEGDPRTPVSAIVQALLFTSHWREDDLFQVPVLLETLLLVDPKRHLLERVDEAMAARLRQLIASVLKARPKRRLGQAQQYSDYITFHCASVYALLYNYVDEDAETLLEGVAITTTSTPEQRETMNVFDYDGGADYDGTISGGDDDEDFNNGDDDKDTDWNSFTDEDDLSSDDVEDDDNRSLGGLPPNALPKGAGAQVALALQRCAEVSHNELCRQLALRGAGDTDAFDIMRLAYSLLTYLVATNSLAGRTAGRELVRGQGPSKGTVVQPLNPHLVQAALQAFFAEQTPNGLWDKGQPIYRSFRRTGRNVGNAFIFAVDTVASLLKIVPAPLLQPYLSHFRRTVHWIEMHSLVEILPDYCDPESGQCYGKAIRGWSSPHLSPDVGPQAWSTAQVIACISRIQTLVATLRHDSVVMEFRGQPHEKRIGTLSSSMAGTPAPPDPSGWNRLLDSDIAEPGGSASNVATTHKEVLDQRMIQPRLPSSSSLVSSSYSAILFGPPGTAKTTICEALASRLGWDFVVIDTSVFLADGLSNVASRIRYVFERLLALRRCVILFDEIEEFCLDREAAGMESRMLTTAMLTALNDLRRAKRSIFFMATNRIRAFDAAITRPGRFDMQLFVGTPNLGARTTQLRNELANVPAPLEPKNDAVLAYQNFLQDKWEENAKFMNYLEGVQFARACANQVRTGEVLDEEYMSRIFQSQVAVMTIRGPVRAEFEASMGLSRL